MLAVIGDAVASLGRGISALGRDVQRAGSAWDWWAAKAKRQATEVTDPYTTVATVYSAITATAQVVSGLPVRLHRGDPSVPVTSGPAYELLHRGTEHAPSLPHLVEQLVGHLVNSGEVHVFDPATALFERLTVCGAQHVSPHLAETTIQGRRGVRVQWWDYTDPLGGSPQHIHPSAHNYAKLFNPNNPIRGLSPMRAAGMDIRQSYLGGVHNARALENGMSPGGAYVLPDYPSPEQREEFEAMLLAKHGGPENAGKPLLLWGGADYRDLAWKNVDLELIAGRRYSREEILSVIGTPPVIVGIFESAHYDVADQAIVTWIDNKIRPLCVTVGALLTLVCRRVEPGVVVDFDTTAHPAMLAIVSRKLDALAKAVANGIPYNEATQLVGLAVKPQKWGERSLLPASYSAAEEVIEGGGLGPGEAPAPEDDVNGPPERLEREEEDEAAGPAGLELAARRDAALEARQQRKYMPRVRTRLRGFFNAYLAETLRRVKRAAEAARHAATVETERAADSPETVVQRILLDLGQQQGKLRKISAEEFERIARETIREELERLGYEPARIDAAVEKLLKSRTVSRALRFKQAKITSVERTLRRRIKATLLEGLRNDETVSQLSERVREAAGKDKTQGWANRIARTEVGSSVSTARFSAAAAAGAEAKGWLHGSNPRPSHARAESRYHPASRPIPLSEPFRVGDAELMYPRDPSGPAGEIVNCNCVMVTTKLKDNKACVVSVIGAGLGGSK